MKRKWWQLIVVWCGRACGLVALVLGAVWLLAPSFGNVMVSSGNGRFAVMICAGWVEAATTTRGRLVVIDDGGDPTLVLVADSGFRLELKRRENGNGASQVKIGSVQGTWWVPAREPSDREGQRWFPGKGPNIGREHWWLPMWCVAALSAVAAGLTEWFQRRHERRARVGRCPACNYNRAGLAADVVCPECGKLP